MSSLRTNSSRTSSQFCILLNGAIKRYLWLHLKCVLFVILLQSFRQAGHLVASPLASHLACLLKIVQALRARTGVLHQVQKTRASHTLLHWTQSLSVSWQQLELLMELQVVSFLSCKGCDYGGPVSCPPACQHCHDSRSSPVEENAVLISTKHQ